VASVTTSILDANLDALALHSPDAVQRIRAAAPRADLRFFDTDDGVPTAQLGEGPTARTLASRRRPLDEAVRQIAPLDIKEAAVFAVAGFGLGYHVAELSRRLGKSGVMIVFEPDVALLRAVLERIDCSAWIERGNVCILTDPDDAAAISSVMRGVEGLVGLGVTLVQHPASTPRLGAATKRFHDILTGVVDSIRMTIITSLVQVRVTMRNLTQNADIYAACGSVGPLAGTCAGRPAIVVSAGPSLRRNIVLLKDPAVRERSVIIAAQTVLRPLLDLGIRPHLITALDYSEINRRFYEGLTAESVEGITLVVEPKVNPSVLMAWPGKVLCTGDATLDLLLGPALSVHHDPAKRLRQGATVAHLAYYLARHLGCDPVALVGQDLGFTDGQYYSAGASIHGIWAGEVNEFKSLELFEWQRIMRMGAHLRPATDTLGRPMFTDAQMHSYLTQFEADFKEDNARGLTIIDATEGGVRKRGTKTQPLRDFLSERLPSGVRATESILSEKLASVGTDAVARSSVLKKLRTRISDVRAQCWQVADISRRTALSLAEMEEHHADQARVDRLIDKVHEHGDEVEKIDPGFNLTQLLAQSTVFNRVRADRLIHLEQEASDLERQKLRIRRDIENVRGLERSAEELCTLLDGCTRVLDGGERITRDIPQSEKELERVGLKRISPTAATQDRTTIVSAVIPIDLDRSGLGWARSLEGPFAGRRSLLAATVDRLLACEELSGIVLLAQDAKRIESLLEPRQLDTGHIRIETGQQANPARSRAIAAGRLWSRACWRGGLADLTCFDEVFDPAVCRAALERTGADAVLLVGPDWVALDPDLCSQVIRRYRESPRENRLTFTQAAPGLCGCVISRDLIRELCAIAGWERIWIASIGGLLGYLPTAPVFDIIAQPVCIGLSGPVRDCGLRLIADTPVMRSALEQALAAQESSNSPTASEIVSRVNDTLKAVPASDLIEELIVRTSPSDFATIARDFAKTGPGRVITLGSLTWDPLDTPEIIDHIAQAKAAGIAGIHLRTTLRTADEETLRRLIQSGADIISVNLEAGPNAARSIEHLERLLAIRTRILGNDGMAIPWIVPRLTRCDATYGMVQEFVNRWVMTCGWAALDPLEHERPNERIAPLPVPATATDRLRRTRRVM
jgi:hypothetical protein